MGAGGVPRQQITCNKVAFRIRKWSIAGLSVCSVCEMKQSHHTCPESRETGGAKAVEPYII